ncbi:MAG: hypothetical protein PHX44_06965 [Sulfurimonas sp.]|uniref:hypothetical protein n=1 Tax=Sulfurimonas sp. TaxID=2022749 RepID=UPI00260A65C0|nr:hypothetical protein [Sulfurimonas sp.]MDD2652773.1 hypothetical protein [Sulfurimonas sp.]MDD3452084.1 hypothetical protein [Sulfurimonas sp.]
MKKFNLFKEIIVTDKKELLEALNSDKTFGLRVDGSVCYEPFGVRDALVFSGIVQTKNSLEEAFGKNYQVVEDEERVLVKAFSNWQEIIGFNKARATYDDTTADGVDEFATKEMEKIGWHATEFNISYRTLVEVLEQECGGTLLCIEYEEPYRFSGLGFVDDLDEARDVLFAFCKKEIERLIATDDDFKKENLSDDEQEAAEFFGVAL